MSAPVDVDDLTAGWLAEVLGTDVRSLRAEAIGTGQTAASYRLTIDGAGGPATLVAKVATGADDVRRAVAAGFRREVGLYADLAGTLDVRVPRCWHAVITDDALRFTLLLEDLAPRRPGAQADGCSPARARAAVANLAGLHASRWNDPSLVDLPYLDPPAARASFMGGLTVRCAEVFLERYGDHLDGGDVETLRAAAAAVEGWYPGGSEPFALLHGDYRLDNLMFGDDEDDVVAIDWQTLAVGPPERDLAYFVANSLPVEARRAAEDDLIAGYHAALLARGVEHHTLADCRRGYRLGQLQAPMITMIGAALSTAERTPAADAMFLSMTRRGCAAVRDLGTLDLL
ncbi:phosphotransferase family protein [Trujillonella endophytica]|uniref:Phosphotransferase enzyme family protein n=1 Tax=Trujillonella endophytica TaxID=673521 RepID=A0A1H8T6E4_9ACTN|nr:phosphotransferase [Trujillella endophytica]SEO86497.1 Phosphotransferase enzyme family protein [Trujillella endophytica]